MGLAFVPRRGTIRCSYLVRQWGTEKIEVDIFTLGKHAWRRIKVSHDEFSLPENYTNIVCLNGALHWIYGKLIYAFDLAEERVRCIPLPPNETRGDTELVVWENCLSVVFQDHFEFHLWSMKEYGITESWNRLLIKTDKSHRRLVPITSWNGGEIFCRTFDTHDSLESYDTNAKMFTRVKIYNTRPNWVTAFNYVPSFTPLKDIFT